MRPLTASQTVEFAFSLSEAPDSLPTGQLKIGTTDDAASVTIAADSGSNNGYTASVTLPGTETTGDVIRCRIDYTVSSTSYSSYLVLGVIDTTNAAVAADTAQEIQDQAQVTQGLLNNGTYGLSAIKTAVDGIDASGTTTAEDIDERLTFTFPRVGSGTIASNQIRVNAGFDGTIAFDLSGVLEDEDTLSSVSTMTATATTGSITFSNLRLHTSKRKVLADTTAISTADTYTISVTVVTATNITAVYKGTLVAS